MNTGMFENPIRLSRVLVELDQDHDPSHRCPSEKRVKLGDIFGQLEAAQRNHQVAYVCEKKFYTPEHYDFHVSPGHHEGAN